MPDPHFETPLDGRRDSLSLNQENTHGRQLTVGSLFAGIGGFDLGFERAGMRTVWFCEQDEFCQRVLAKHWPGIPCYGDIRELRGDAVEPVDVLCGGFPCQDISSAGKGAGLAGARSGLWSEYARLVGELRPAYVVVENVPLLRTRGLDQVLEGFDACGYDAEWDGISASAVGAPHKRDRIWLVAYPPAASSYGSNRGGAAGRTGPVRHSLASMARHDLWPTATARDHKDGPFPAAMARKSPGLGTVVHMWPTPKASTAGPDLAKLDRSTTGVSLPTAVEIERRKDESPPGQLNPTWVEWLMGFPLGWTDCGPSATRSSRRSRSGSATASSPTGTPVPDQTAIPIPEGPVIVLCHWCSATAVQTDVDITRPGVRAHKTPRVNLCAAHLAMVHRSFDERVAEAKAHRADPLCGYKGPGR